MAIKDFKSIIISVNIDMLLKNTTKSTERCARNIIELGLASTLKENLKLQKELLEKNLITLLKVGNAIEIKQWFFKTFF